MTAVLEFCSGVALSRSFSSFLSSLSNLHPNSEVFFYLTQALHLSTKTFHLHDQHPPLESATIAAKWDISPYPVQFNPNTKSLPNPPILLNAPRLQSISTIQVQEMEDPSILRENPGLPIIFVGQVINRQKDFIMPYKAVYKVMDDDSIFFFFTFLGRK